ncbi:hypothetical protein HPP92_015064 [Vanilla planifolia]|uniref:Pectinesterase inhibitor domain-containing protein n=1 Tax=Vanilla planifolia TaxID=51239 RepID=A0A835QQS6_VANPL|nr:hypothetical protein HPP92_015064 [Vanilla planifolia]
MARNELLTCQTTIFSILSKQNHVTHLLDYSSFFYLIQRNGNDNHRLKESKNKRMKRSNLALVVAIPPCFGLAVASTAEFVRSSCQTTNYPDLCEKYLSAYAPKVRRSPRQLARAALTVTADRTAAASKFVERFSTPRGRPSPSARGARGGGAVRDCLETLADSVDRLRRSVREMERMGRYGSQSFRWHLGNVQTWVSAALTDENTCLDSLAQDRSAAAVRPMIRSQVVHVSHLTSNALALINRLDPNH